MTHEVTLCSVESLGLFQFRLRGSERHLTPWLRNFSDISLGHCFPTEQKGGSSNRYLTTTLNLSCLDGFISYHASAELTSSICMAICMILSSSAVK